MSYIGFGRKNHFFNGTDGRVQRLLLLMYCSGCDRKLKLRDCPWDESACTEAADYGERDVLAAVAAFANTSLPMG